MKPGALRVNPYDRDGVAEAINRAFQMPPEERRSRMRRSVQEQDIFWWVNSFLSAGQDPEHYTRRGDGVEALTAGDA